MSPASPPSVSTTCGRPLSRACAAIRGCGANVGRARHAARIESSAIDHRLSSASLEVIVTASMSPSRNASASPCTPERGPRAPVARDRVHARAARAQRVAQAARARRRRAGSARVFRARRRAPASSSNPSLSNVVAGMRAPAMPAAASASAVPGPRCEDHEPRGPVARDQARRTRRHWAK